MVSAGNVATAGIFTLLAVLLVLQLTKEPRPVTPSARPPVTTAAGPAADAAAAPPMRAVILPPPPEFRATPRTPPAAATPAPAISSAAPPPPLPAPRPAPPLATETPKPQPPRAAAPAPAISAPAIPAPAAAPPPAPAPAAPPATASVPASPVPTGGLRIDPAEASPVLAEGRVLLRLLEHGRGPAIEIAWPDDEAGANGLYRLLEQCYGMRIALLDADGRLWGSDGAGPRGGAIDLDRFSGFVREPKGFAPAEESRRAAALKARYAGAETARVVRVFPRAVDAALVGGLRQLLGPRYDNAQTIRAAYARDGAALAIDAIVVDGVAARGRIIFVPSRDEPCGQGL